MQPVMQLHFGWSPRLEEGTGVRQQRCGCLVRHSKDGSLICKPAPGAQESRQH
jgi:hypothetical protein